jgi:hypothetical protein
MEKVLFNISAALSPNAFNGYVNSIKISPTEDKLVGISGNWMTVEVCCYFWTKPGGFNRSDYGDETDATIC